MYIVTTAASTRKSVLESEERNACAAPWNCISIASGSSSSAAARSIAATASPSEAPAPRLNETVTAGNWPTWLMSRAAERSVTRAMLASGTGRPEPDSTNTDSRAGRARSHAGIRLEHHPVLAGLGEECGDLALAERAVEGVVDVGDADAEPAGGVAINFNVRLQSLVLEVAGDIGQFRLLLEVRHQTRHPFVEDGPVGRGERELKLRAAHPVFDRELLHRLQVEGDARDLVGRIAQPVDDFERPSPCALRAA
jgi:hypothetical protein